MISEIIGNIALGSVVATPDFGSATADFVSLIPAQLIQTVGGIFYTLGS